jgi:hypothetical protein
MITFFMSIPSSGLFAERLSRGGRWSGLGCLKGGCCFTGGDFSGVLLDDLGHLDR